MAKRLANNLTVKSLIKTLWEDDFFKVPRGLSEIKKEFAAKGYHFPLPTLSVALMRLTRTGETISRAQKNGKWTYVQKNPPFIKKVNKSFVNYNFHPRINAVAWPQFEDGHYKESIQNALVEVVDQVKIKTNYPKTPNGRDLDGDDLMNRVFGCDNQTPMIKFNSLATSLDKAEQRGIMNLFKGIVGIRDKKAHLNFIQNDPLKTIEYLSLASLLVRLLDENAPRL